MARRAIPRIICSCCITAIQEATVALHHAQHMASTSAKHLHSDADTHEKDPDRLGKEEGRRPKTAVINVAKQWQMVNGIISCLCPRGRNSQDPGDLPTSRSTSRWPRHSSRRGERSLQGQQETPCAARRATMMGQKSDPALTLWPWAVCTHSTQKPAQRREAQTREQSLPLLYREPCIHVHSTFTHAGWHTALTPDNFTP